MRAALGLLLIIVAAACNSLAPLAPAPVTSTANVFEPHVTRESAAWAVTTQSPWRPAVDDARDPREVALAALCGEEDAALSRVARDIVAARARGLGTPDADAILGKLRAAGVPQVRPRLVIASGRAPLDESRLRRELSAAKGTRAPSRCGVAIGPSAQGELLVALRVEALADLAPLPTRARTGEWLTLEARLHVAARSAKLVVLGPHGTPRTVPTALDPGTGALHARFALDQPGAFLLQLVGDLAEGPRPLLEARVFADVAPTTPGEEPAAPGEEAGSTANDANALALMIAALRVFEGSPPLLRDATLDTLARVHAERMRDGHAVGHDVGDGDFLARFEADGSLDARAVGENVAHAPSVALAHRALHASPSHRINLLRTDFTHLGVGMARAADGTVYVCETFAAARPAHADR